MEVRTKALLEFLEQYGVAQAENIAPLLNEFFPLQDRHSHPEVSAKAGKVIKFTYRLRDEGLIDIGNTALSNLGSGNSSAGHTWLTDIVVKASITLKGLEYLEKEMAKAGSEELRISMLATNNSVIKTNAITQENVKSQKSLTTTALVIAGASVVVAIIGLFGPCNNPNKELIDRLNKTDSLLNGIMKQVDSGSHALQGIDQTLKGLKPDTTRKK